jgi:AmiR/NasT family two-component response regulator
VIEVETLAEVFVEVADTLVDDFDLVDFLQTLTARSVGLFDVSAAGLLLADHQGRLHLMAASDERAQMLELFQLQAHEGPCHDCFSQGSAVGSPDLELAAGRWPRFAPRALESGYRAVHAFPLRLRNEVFGALNLFDTRQGAMEAASPRVVQAVADVATMALLQERAVHRAELLTEQLQGALNTRVAIEQAKGVLSQVHGCDVDEAFTRLRSYARSRGETLSQVARDVTSDPEQVRELTTPPQPQRRRPEQKQHATDARAPRSGGQRSLSEAIAAAAREMESEVEPAAVMEKAVELGRHLVTNAQEAGISLLHGGGRVDSPAVSSDLVSRLDELQYEFDEGPCLDAVRVQQVVRSPDVRNDERWPRWGQAAAEETGLRSMLCFRLFTQGDKLGAINFYSRQTDAFDDDDVENGLAIAAHISIAMSAARRADQLKVAVDSRAVIGQASGILMERFDIDADRAFAALARISSYSNRKLRDIAAELVATRRVPHDDEDRRGADVRDAARG